MRRESDACRHCTTCASHHTVEGFRAEPFFPQVAQREDVVSQRGVQQEINGLFRSVQNTYLAQNSSDSLRSDREGGRGTDEGRPFGMRQAARGGERENGRRGRQRGERGGRLD